MGFLEMIHLHHSWEPDFARRLLGAAFFVDEPGKVLRLKPGNPRIHGRPGHVHKATDAEFVPALIVEFHDLEPGLIAIGIGMVGPELELLLRGHGALLPEDFGGLVIEGIRALAEDNPREFAVVKPAIEGFEAVNLPPDIIGNGARARASSDLDIAG